MPSASPCTATYEAASTVEVCSLCSPRSTCTETRRVCMIETIIIIEIVAITIYLLNQ
jgi:hypothetical protein